MVLLQPMTWNLTLPPPSRGSSSSEEERKRAEQEHHQREQQRLMVSRQEARERTSYYSAVSFILFVLNYSIDKDAGISFNFKNFTNIEKDCVHVSAISFVFVLKRWS